MRVSPIVFYYLCSNGYMRSSDDMQSVMQLFSKHGYSKELFNFVSEARTNTRLVMILNDQNALSYEYDLNFADNTCFGNVLEISTTLKKHQIVFMQNDDYVMSNIDTFICSYIGRKRTWISCCPLSLTRTKR